MKLENTVYVPDLRTHLMLVARIYDKGFEVTFMKSSAVIRDENGIEKLYANRIDGLYYLQETPEVASAMSESDHSQKLELWHRRLGHLNVKDVKSLMKNEGIECPENESLGVCETCVVGKLAQRPFPKTSLQKKRLLELIHTDLCGPMREKSLSGAKYFATFVDDATRWCVVKFLKTKNELPKAFQNYQRMVEKQTGSQIKCVQSYNGKEYRNHDLDQCLENCGINRRFSIPHTPEQNGVAERKNRALVEMARC